jgi:hypothetical protein
MYDFRGGMETEWKRFRIYGDDDGALTASYKEAIEGFLAHLHYESCRMEEPQVVVIVRTLRMDDRLCTQALVTAQMLALSTRFYQVNMTPETIQAVMLHLYFPVN